MNRILLIVVVAACSLLACALLATGVLLSFATGSAGCTLPSGRSVNVTSSGWSLSVTNSKDTAVIETTTHKIIVAPNFVDVDDQQIVEIDPATKNVEINVAWRGISIVGDGKSYGTVK